MLLHMKHSWTTRTPCHIPNQGAHQSHAHQRLCSQHVHTSQLPTHQEAIPKEICNQIHVLFTKDHTTAQLHIASLLQSKKGKNSPDANSQHGEELSAEQSVFDLVKKMYSKGKGKGKALLIQPAAETVGPSNLPNPCSQTLIPSSLELTFQDYINTNQHFLFHPLQLISQAGPSTAPAALPFASGSQAPPMIYLPPPMEPFIPYGVCPKGLLMALLPCCTSIIAHCHILIHLTFLLSHRFITHLDHNRYIAFQLYASFHNYVFAWNTLK